MPEFLSASLRHRFTWAVGPDPLRRDTVPPDEQQIRAGRPVRPARSPGMAGMLCRATANACRRMYPYSI